MAGLAQCADSSAREQTYVERPPVPALAGVVSAVWIQRIGSGAEPYTHRNVPSGGVELLCPIRAVPRVVGPLTQAAVEVLPPGMTLVGLRFHPGAASPAVGVPASELVDVTVDADSVWGDTAVAVGERVDEAPSPEHALAALQEHVAGRVARASATDEVVSALVRQLRWRTDDVTALTRTLHFSERQLRRRCQAAVGLSPKELHRILRFQGFLALAQHAIAHGRAPTDDGLAMLAAEAAYADQSHLSRECVRLTGVSPRAFLGEAEHACGCGHDHAASFMPLLQARRGNGSPAGA